MRRIVGVFLLFCLFFGFIPNVNAESYDLIYSITSLNMDTDNQIMRFTGFSFIDHMDNYGGENLKTYIIATGGGKKPKRFEVTYTDMNNGQSGYYWTRCEGSGCSIGKIDQLLKTKRQSSKCNVTGKADCAYFNVEFELEIDMIDLNVYFGANTNISFEIETVNSINNTKRTSGLGVHKIVCGIDGIRGTCSNKYIDLGIDNKGKVVLGGVGETITVTANRARARIISGGAPTVVKPSIYYGGSFGTLDYLINQQSNKDDGAPFITNYYIVNGQKSGGQIINGGSTQYAIYDSWVKVDGQMSIRFGEMPVVEPKPADYCPSEYLDTDISKTTKCNNKDVEFKSCKTYEVSFKAEYDLSDNLSSNEEYCGDLPVVDIMVKASILILEEGVFNFGSTTDSVFAGKSFDFPEITYLNKIKWQFAKGSDNEKITSVSILDGNGNSTHSKTLNYGKEDKNWADGNSCSTVFDTATQSYVKRDPGCVETDGYYETYCDSDAGSHEIKLSDTVTYNGESGTINSFIKKKAIEKVKDMIKDYDNYSEEVIDDSDIKSYDSNNANSSLKKISDGISGVWKRVDSDEWNDENLKEDTYYSSTYEFDLYNSCVKLIGSDIGNIEYKAKNCSTNYKKYGSNSYFVPFQFASGSDAFKVNIVENDISFVEGIEWNLSGTCSIDVENKVYKNDGDPGGPGIGDKLKVRYRSISLMDPFPKNIVPVNWSSWIAVEKNKKRLKDTYNNDVIYSVSLKNGNSDGFSLGIDNINRDSTLGDYNDFNMNKNGTSKFIYKGQYNQYFDMNVTSTSWCWIGEFNSNCDRYG